ncbi:unnamed protein product [Heterobilharzia americana]|nr:unnamed protein product [Heterobilharzia americana]CAH8490921.1 unnamed protein product [Heterobilharzia americana]
MVSLQIKEERTYRLRLSTRSEIAQGCLIKEYHFDCSLVTFFKEIHFTNSYSKRVSAQLCYLDNDTEEPIWVELFELELMKDPHSSSGSCTDIKISLPPTFVTVKSQTRLLKLCLLLQQPSPIWKEFTITNVKLFDEYLNKANQEKTGTSKGTDTCQVNDAQDTLVTLCSFIQYKQGTRSFEMASKTDISSLADGHFETT